MGIENKTNPEIQDSYVLYPFLYEYLEDKNFGREQVMTVIGPKYLQTLVNYFKLYYSRLTNSENNKNINSGKMDKLRESVWTAYELIPQNFKDEAQKLYDADKGIKKT